jgi:hypothetical protein
MLLGGQVAISPCRCLGRERSRHTSLKPPAGPLTPARTIGGQPRNPSRNCVPFPPKTKVDPPVSQGRPHLGARIGPLVRTFIVLISPCGSGVLHGMRQRPPVFRHSHRIASIEPPLTEWTPGKAIGIERSVLACASSAIGHLKPLS